MWIYQFGSKLIFFIYYEIEHVERSKNNSHKLSKLSLMPRIYNLDICWDTFQLNF